MAFILLLRLSSSEVGLLFGGVVTVEVSELGLVVARLRVDFDCLICGLAPHCKLRKGANEARLRALLLASS